MKELKNIKINIYSDSTQLYNDLANKLIIEIKKNPNIHLGLATGSTPIPLYRNLIKAYQDNLISFKDVKTFNLDEYIGLTDEFQSYRYYMNTLLFKHIDININNTHIPNANMDTLNESIEDYNKLLDNNIIDIQILGIGSNAHIGFNEPGTNFKNKTTVVKLAEATTRANQRFFEHLDLVPTKAITMGIKSIMAAREIILIAVGLNKAAAIKNTLEGPITNKVPASILQKHPNVKIYLDKEAASLLSKD